MKNVKVYLSAALVMALPMLSAAAGEADKSIYGEDNRINYWDASSGLKTVSDSVVSLWKSYKVLESATAGKYELTTRTLGDAKTLCPGQSFRDEKVGAFCSGSLVGEDLVMTAGHCIKSADDCAATKFVFGFRVNANGGTGESLIDKGDVYGCSSIVKRYLTGEDNAPAPAGQALGADYALVKLDRKVANHKPLPINRGGLLSKGTKLFVIGHPSGLPLKVAADSKVRDASKVGYFVADLDTFGGNSGSAVFNAATKKIEGILVRGDDDYIPGPTGECNVVATYDQEGGRGEDVTKITALSSFIPRLAGEKDEDTVTKVDSKDLKPVKAAPADAAKVKF